MTDANVVPLHPFDDAEALAWMRAHLDAEASVSDLARQFRWSPSKLRRRVAAWAGAGHVTRRVDGKGRILIAPVRIEQQKRPRRRRESEEAATTPPITPDVAAPGPLPARTRLVGGTAALLLATALALAVVGLGMNARFAASFGQSPEAAVMLAAIGLALDLLALVLPTAAAILWQRRSHAAALMSWAIWLIALTMTLLAAMGFAATNIGDSVVGRERIALEATVLAEKLERLRTERAGIAETGAVAAIEVALQQAQPGAQAVWRITDGCHDVTRPASARVCAPVLQLRERLATAQRRDALDAELQVVQARLTSLPSVGASDPQAATAAEMIHWLSVGRISPTSKDVDRLRTIGLTIAPALAGLVAMLALCLGRPPGTRPLAGVRKRSSARTPPTAPVPEPAAQASA